MPVKPSNHRLASPLRFTLQGLPQSEIHGLWATTPRQVPSSRKRILEGGVLTLCDRSGSAGLASSPPPTARDINTAALCAYTVAGEVAVGERQVDVHDLDVLILNAPVGSAQNFDRSNVLLLTRLGGHVSRGNTGLSLR